MIKNNISSRNAESDMFEINCRVCDLNDSIPPTPLHSMVDPLTTVLSFIQSEHMDIRYNGIQCVLSLYNHCTSRPCLDHLKNIILQLYTEKEPRILYSFRQNFDKFAFLGFSRELARENTERYLLNQDKNTLQEMKQMFFKILTLVTELCYQSLLDVGKQHLQETIVETLLVWGL